MLTSLKSDKVVLVDTFDNPVRVNRKDLSQKLITTYEQVMQEWYNEWIELEKKR